MALNAHPNDLIPGSLHHIIFLGDQEDIPFPPESPKGWCRFEGWQLLTLETETKFYAKFTMEDGCLVVLSVDMITGRHVIKNLANTFGDLSWKIPSGYDEKMQAFVYEKD